MFLISTKGNNKSDIWICSTVYQCTSRIHHCLTSRSSEKNAIRGIFKLGRAGSVSWHQHLCSTSDHFFRPCDNCYQVSARINSFWISLIRSVAAISPDTYLRWRFGNASNISQLPQRKEGKLHLRDSSWSLTVPKSSSSWDRIAAECWRESDKT